MGNVRLYGSTSGYTELAAPAVAPDGVLTLPAVAGTLATTADITTAVAAIVPGKILQVVSVTKVDTFSTSSTSFVDVTGLTANITPASVSNKVLVIYKVGVNSSFTNLGYLQLLRDATAIGGGTATGSRPSAMSVFRTATAYGTMDLSGLYLDSPASVSSQTYKIQTRTNSNSFSINTSNDDGDDAAAARTSSTITLIEVAA